MKPPKSSQAYHPFQNLKALLKAKSICLPDAPPLEIAIPESEEGPELEEKLFSDAMKGVTPISRDNRGERIFRLKRPGFILPEGSPEEEDAEALSRLKDLIRDGTGFDIIDTPEYVEGTGYRIPPEIARCLHRGKFSIQAHVDLHGLTVEDAQKVFEKFLRWSVRTGKNGILIIHGRGLSSPAAPVLKTKVMEWLTHGPWRKWVIAYASARLCDGGAGATYVLLGRHPASKRGKSSRRN